MRSSLLILLCLAVAVAYSATEPSYAMVSGNPSSGSISFVAVDGSDQQTVFTSNTQHPTAVFYGNDNVFYGQYRKDTQSPSLVMASSIQYVTPRLITDFSDSPGTIISQLYSTHEERVVYVLLRREGTNDNQYDSPERNENFDCLFEVDVLTGNKTLILSIDESDTSSPVPTSFWIDFTQSRVFFSANSITKSVGHSTNSGIWEVSLIRDGKPPTLKGVVSDLDSFVTTTINNLQSMDGDTFYYILHVANRTSHIQSLNIKNNVVINSDNDFHPDQFKIVPSAISRSYLMFARQANTFYRGNVQNGDASGLTEDTAIQIDDPITNFDITDDADFVTYVDRRKSVVWRYTVENKEKKSVSCGIDESVAFYVHSSPTDIDIYFSSYDTISHVSKNSPFENVLATNGDVIAHMAGYSSGENQYDFFYNIRGKKTIISTQLDTKIVFTGSLTALTVDEVNMYLYFCIYSQNQDQTVISRAPVNLTDTSQFFTLSGAISSINFGIDGLLYYGNANGTYYINPNSTEDSGLSLARTTDIKPYSMVSLGDTLYYLNIEEDSFKIGSCIMDGDDCHRQDDAVISFPKPHADEKAWMIGIPSLNRIFWTANSLSGNIYSYDTENSTALVVPFIFAPIVDVQTTGLAVTPDETIVYTAFGVDGIYGFSSQTGFNVTKNILPPEGFSYGSIVISSSNEFYWVDVFTGSIMYCENIESCSDNYSILDTPNNRDCSSSQFLRVSNDYLYYQLGCGGIKRVNLTSQFVSTIQDELSVSISDVVVMNGDMNILSSLSQKKEILTADIVNDQIVDSTTFVVGSGAFESLAVGTKFDDDDNLPRLHWIDPSSNKLMMYHDEHLTSIFPTEDFAGLFEFQNVLPPRTPSQSPTRTQGSASQTFRFSGTETNNPSATPSPEYPPVIDQEGWIFIGCFIAIIIILCCVPLVYCAWRDSKQKETALSLRFMD